MSSDALLTALIGASLSSGGLLATWWRVERRRRVRVAIAMHELRRPLQALLLSEALGSGGGRRMGSIDLAIAALGDLEATLGSKLTRAAPEQPARPSWRQLLLDAADRWQQAAWLCGRTITVVAGSDGDDGELRLNGCEDVVPAGQDAIRLAGALDNLILNSLLHGSGEVRLGLRRSCGRVEILVADGDRPPPVLPSGRSVPEPRHGDQGPGRHGHGLRVVAEIASALGGSFSLDRRRDGSGSAAVLALPEYRFSS